MSYQPSGYGTYPGKRTDFSLMMNSQDAELQPLDGNIAGTPIRSILRNKSDTPAKDFYDVYDTYGTTSALNKVQIEAEPPRRRKTGRCRWFCERILRPCLAEYLSVVLTIVVYFHMESQLIQRQVTLVPKILVLSVVDSILYAIFFATFQTVHINPMITIAQAFTLTTQWYLCILFLMMQALGTISGAALVFVFNEDTFPSKPKVILDLSQEWAKGASEMFICQAIGTALVILANMMVTRPYEKDNVVWRQLYRSPLCVAGAIALCSLLSLFHSNVSWNPLYMVVMVLLEWLHGKGLTLVFDHLLFWSGPVIGALLGTIVFKLLFAPANEKRSLDFH
uniref:Aquaporin-2 n=1 Tax=Panagrellus redivivus TaxID=6233 RepID=A0A7E4V658_PANRE